jgi:hypothetical protein
VSDFDTAARTLGRKVGVLTPRAQSALFIAVAECLLPELARSGFGGEASVRRALIVAEAYAVTGSAPREARQSSAMLRATVPTIADVAARDCWACADISISLVLGGAQAVEGAHFLIEPVLASVSAETRSKDEDAVLEHPRLRSVLSLLDNALAFLDAREDISHADLEWLESTLRPLAPRSLARAA